MKLFTLTRGWRKDLVEFVERLPVVDTNLVFLSKYEYDIVLETLGAPCAICDLARMHPDHQGLDKKHEFEPVETKPKKKAEKSRVEPYLVIGSDLESFADRVQQVLEGGFGLHTMPITTFLDTASVGIAISKDKFDMRDAEQMLDPENDPVAKRCSQCSMRYESCINPEHCNDELPEGMRPFGPDEFKAFGGAKSLPNGSRPYTGTVVYDKMSRTVVIGCDDDGVVRLTLFVDDLYYDRAFKGEGGVEYALHLYDLMRELGKQGKFQYPTAIELLGFESAN